MAKPKQPRKAAAGAGTTAVTLLRTLPLLIDGGEGGKKARKRSGGALEGEPTDRPAGSERERFCGGLDLTEVSEARPASPMNDTNKQSRRLKIASWLVLLLLTKRGLADFASASPAGR
jgi:hypothetical protein